MKRLILSCFAVLALQTTVQAQEKIAMVIMPFKNISQNTADDWLKDSFSENLTAGLSAVPELRLIERAEVDVLIKEQIFAQTALVDSQKAPQIGKLLGAQYMVLGGYQKVGESLVIQARVVNISTGEILSETVTRVKGESSKLFDLQEELALKLVENLKLTSVFPAIKQKIENRLVTTSSPLAHQYYMLAKKELELGAEHSLNQSLKLLHEALRLDPKYAQAVALLGQAYLQRYQTLGLYASAQKEDLSQGKIKAQQAIALAPQSPEGYIALAQAYFLQDQAPQAFDTIKKALSMDSGNAALLSYIALRFQEQVLVEPGFAKALDQESRRLLGVKPLDPLVQLKLASVYLAEMPFHPQMDITPGFQLITAAYQARPEHPLIQLIDGSYRMILNQTAEAKKRFEHLAKTHADNAHLLTLLANTQRYVDAEAALQTAQAALKLDSAYPKTYLVMAEIYREQLKQPQQANHWFQKALEHLNSPAYHMDAGVFLFQGGEYKKALPYFEKLIQALDQGKLQMNHQARVKLRLTAQFLLARSFLFLDQDSQARAHLIQISQHPLAGNVLRSQAHRSLSTLFLKSGQPQEALQAYQSFLKHSPHNRALPEIQTELRVIELYAQLHKDPKDIPTLYELGMRFYQTQQYPAALKMFQTLLKLQPSHPEAHYYMAKVYEALGESEESKNWMGKFMQRAPNHPLLKERPADQPLP